MIEPQPAKTFLKRTGLALVFLFPWVIFGILSYSHRQVAQDPSPAADRGREARLGRVLGQDIVEWPRLSNPDKEEALQRAELFFQRRMNVGIMKSLDFYIEEMDRLMKSYEPVKERTNLLIALRYLAVKNNDFYDGQDFAKTAVEVLGSTLAKQVQDGEARHKKGGH